MCPLSRAHPSFSPVPTRRSADLDVRVVGSGAWAGRRPTPEELVTIRAEDVESAFAEVTERYRGYDETPTLEEALASLEEMIDRKSTRLNSSHVKNSYAGLCLKKKTKEQREGRQLCQSCKYQQNAASPDCV